ncbi:MAG: STAS/SEC14 domain-containing protein [Roseicyclus sp.]
MITTETIKEFDIGMPRVHAFRIVSEVTREDMDAMAAHMNEVFDRDDGKVDMLLVFETEETSETGAGWSAEAMKSRFKSLANVRNYVVANPPEGAGGMISAMDKIMPVDARVFDSEREAVAWLKSQPVAA